MCLGTRGEGFKNAEDKCATTSIRGPDVDKFPFYTAGAQSSERRYPLARESILVQRRIRGWTMRNGDDEWFLSPPGLLCNIHQAAVLRITAQSSFVLFSNSVQLGRPFMFFLFFFVPPSSRLQLLLFKGKPESQVRFPLENPFTLSPTRALGCLASILIKPLAGFATQKFSLRRRRKSMGNMPELCA